MARVLLFHLPAELHFELLHGGQHLGANALDEFRIAGELRWVNLLHLADERLDVFAEVVAVIVLLALLLLADGLAQLLQVAQTFAISALHAVQASIGKLNLTVTSIHGPKVAATIATAAPSGHAGLPAATASSGLAPALTLLTLTLLTLALALSLLALTLGLALSLLSLLTLRLALSGLPLLTLLALTGLPLTWLLALAPLPGLLALSLLALTCHLFHARAHIFQAIQGVFDTGLALAILLTTGPGGGVLDAIF